MPVTRSRDEAAIELPLMMRLGVRRDMASARFTQIAQHHAEAEHDPVAGAAASAALLELLLWLAMRAHSASPSAPVARGRADAAAEDAAHLIERRLGDTLTVPEIAAAVELSQNYLAKAFRRRFGVTIPRYILTRRIELAKSLLATTNLPIGRIAERVGLPDPQHFNKQFRRLTGQSPSAARAAITMRTNSRQVRP